MIVKLKRKVLAYITKGEQQERKILVFEHKNNPHAGIQVPGGTIEEHELLLDALYREIEEESGLQKNQLQLKSKVRKTKYFPKDRNEIYERTIFHLDFIGHDEHEWEHEVYGDGEDDGLVFCYRWVPLHSIPTLAAKQGEAIEFIS